MKKKPTQSKVVRIKAKDLKPPTRADIDRLLKAMDGPIDTSDIPDQSASLKAGKFRRGTPPLPRKSGKVA